MSERKPEKNENAGKQRKRRGWWWRIKWVIRLGVLGLIVWKLIVGFDNFFYQPDRRVHFTPDTFRLEYEEISFKAADGVTLSGWFMPAEGRPKGTVVHFHGNAQNMTAHFTFVTWLPPAGYNLLVFDYRGYGKSEGEVTRAGTIADGHAALDYLLSRPDVDPQLLFVFGQSLGGAIATVVVAERPEVRALVLDSTFSSYRGMGAAVLRRIVGVDWLARTGARLALSDGHDPIDVVAEISPRPLLVITSGQDNICPPELGRELFEAAGDPKELWHVPDAIHTGVFEVHGSEAERRIIEWFEHAVADD